MKRLLFLLLVLLLIPLSIGAEEPDETDDAWETLGYSEYAEVQGDTLIIRDGLTTLGRADEDEWLFGGLPLPEDGLEDGPRFDFSFDETDFRRVSLPSTLRFIGDEAFILHHFEAFTLPSNLELLADSAFVYCNFDVLRIETVLPASVILDSLYDCYVTAYEVPEDHPLYRSVDGVLFSRDGKTLIAYPNGCRDTHYDVPTGVERIGSMQNEYLQTVSLPIGLKAVDDYGFAGCTRLQAIALPLTVQKLGKNVFHACVSLELVSLPEGLEADKNLDDRWTKYYADDAIYRGDNGDTIAGAASEGVINAPGRLFNPDARDYPDWSTGTRRKLISIYDSADDASSRRAFFGGKTVYLGQFKNGRAALYEPLGGTYTAADGYGSIIGWANMADVQYLRPEALFTYAEVKPRSPMKVWWNHLPEYAYWTPWETVIPLEGRTYKATLFGAFVRFDDPVTHAVFGCAIQDAELTRKPDGTDQVYGVVCNAEFLNDIPLLAAPDGEELKQLPGGTQIRILEEDGRWYRVTDGMTTGWVAREHVCIVPVKLGGET